MNNVIENIKKNSSLVAEQLKLNFDNQSVKFLEGFIERQKERMGGKSIDGLVNTLGSYLGECVIKNYGGSWKQAEDGTVYVEFDDKNAVYPFTKIRKQFNNGLTDSIYSFYSLIPSIFGKNK